MAESNFIDYVKIFCASGHGGAGSMHLHGPNTSRKAVLTEETEDVADTLS